MKRLYSLLIFLLLCVFSFADDGWTVSTDDTCNYSGVTLANGRIGIVSTPSLMSVSEIILNGVFDKEFEDGVSKMVRSQLFMNLALKIDGVDVNMRNISNWKQTLNMHNGSLMTSFSYNDTKVEYTLRAMRNLPYMSIGELSILPAKDIDIEVSNEILFPEELNDTKVELRVMRDGNNLLPICVSRAKTRTGMHEIFTSTSFLVDNNLRNNESFEDGKMTFRLHVKKGVKCIIPLAGAVCTTRDFNDPKGESERMVVYALQNSYNDIITTHNKAWNELWENDIIIEGCDDDQQDVRMALYHLYSFQRKDSRLSISPMGLSSIGYNGHVFWDSEIWMLPPILILNTDLARCHIDYRTDRLGKALQKASNYGFKGAMFPWESDDNGEESTPTWCLTGTFEHHVTADVAIAFWNYFCVTKDLDWLRNEGYKVIKEVADFWVSRSTKNNDGSYSIKNVVGADEYAQNVDDNAFNNGAAKVALTNAVKASKVLGIQYDEQWQEVADNLRFHYMNDGTMKEHASYHGEMIKQADVNLLAYPLGIVDDKESIVRDLKYYEDKIDKKNGPAMGYSIMSILYSRLGDVDKAYEMFKRSYIPNKRKPFGVLSESASSNNPYFATGAGGMLQAVLFGFGGLNINDNGVVRTDVQLPRQWKSLTIKGKGIPNSIITIR